MNFKTKPLLIPSVFTASFILVRSCLAPGLTVPVLYIDLGDITPFDIFVEKFQKTLQDSYNQSLRRTLFSLSVTPLRPPTRS